MYRYKEVIQIFLAERIKTSRKQHGLTQEAMAETLNISSRSYSYLESGTFCCSASTLMFYILILTDAELIQLRLEFRALVEKEEHNVVA